jgi:polyhydroxybutyrate depolymerase
MKRLSICVLLAACGGGDPEDPPPTIFGGDRSVELQVPDVEPGETYPLVLLLHGHGISGLIQQAYLKLDLVDGRGVFLLAPDGSLSDVDGHSYWNAESGCCNHGDDSVDDVAYLGGLIDDVMAAWPIDPARVYVWGHSNGAFMSYRMACERADVVVGIAPLAGAATSLGGVDDCDPSQPVNVLHIHGTTDSTVPYDGANFGKGEFPGAIESVDQWQAHDGCDATRTDGDAIDLEMDVDGAETTVEDADGCPDGGAVSLWSMVGAGHIPDVVPGYGDLVLDWLLAHPRP